MKKKLLFMVVIIVMTASLAVSCGDSSSSLKRGTWKDNTYTSDFANIKFEMPEDWVSATDEEIAAQMGIVVDELNKGGTAYSKKLLELQTIIDMMVQSPTGSNVIIMFENLSLVVGGTKTSEDEYIEITKGQLEGYTFGDVTTKTFCGEKYKVLPASVEGAYNQYFYVRKVDKYMIGVVITLTLDDDIAEVEEYFSAAK